MMGLMNGGRNVTIEHVNKILSLSETMFGCFLFVDCLKILNLMCLKLSYLLLDKKNMSMIFDILTHLIFYGVHCSAKCESCECQPAA